MWAAGPAMPSPGEPQAEPTIGKAIKGGYDLREAKCNRCDRVSLVALRSLTHPPETPRVGRTRKAKTACSKKLVAEFIKQN
jgi:hypothetical protein